MPQPARDALHTADPPSPATPAPTPTPVEIHCADWLPAAALLAPASVDMLYADPPFNTGRRQQGRGGSYTDSWPSIEDWLSWLRKRLVATLPALKPSACILLHLDFRTSHRARCLLDDLLGADRFVNHLIWSYGLGGSSPRRFARKHDDILFYCLDPALYYFEAPRVPASSNRLRGQTKKSTDVLAIDDPGDSDPSDVLDIPSINNMAGERTGYPTQKPLALLELLTRACCPPGGLLLDPCCGSGTSLLAAARCGRRAIGFDMSPQAVEIAAARLRQPAPPAAAR